MVIFTGDWFFRLLESRLPQALLDLIPLVTPVPAMGLAALSAAVPAGSWSWCWLSTGWGPPPSAATPHPVPHRPVVRHRPGGLLRAVFSWFIGMSLPVLPWSTAPWPPLIILLVWLYSAGTSCCWGRWPGGYGDSSGPLWRRLTAVHLLCYNRKNRPGGTGLPEWKGAHPMKQVIQLSSPPPPSALLPGRQDRRSAVHLRPDPRRPCHRRRPEGRHPGPGPAVHQHQGHPQRRRDQHGQAVVKTTVFSTI